MLTITRSMQLYQLLRLGSVVLTSILLAKSGLSLGEIGAYEALLYIGSVAAFFWANGLLQGIAPVYARLDEQERPAFLFSVFGLFCGAALVVSAAIWFSQQWAVPALTGLGGVPDLGWFVLYLFFNLATLPVEHLYLLRKKPGALAGWGFASFGLYVVALAWPVFCGWGLQAGLQALAVLGALRFLWAVGLMAKQGAWYWRPDLLRQYGWFSAPLVANLLVGNLVLLFDSWLVGWYFQDESVFALFRYGSREFPLATALATALGTAMTAHIAANPARAGLTELKNQGIRLFHIVFPSTIVLLFLSKKLFPVVFSPAFAAAAPLFNIYLLLTASRVLLPNAIVLAKGQPRAILAVGLAELAIKIILGLLFVQAWGLAGLAWSAVLAFWVEKIGLIWYLEKRMGVRTSDWLDLRWYMGYAMTLLLAWHVSTLL
ncbi:MAG: lipid II flippase MurJ [Saprospiraceae bacterium]